MFKQTKSILQDQRGIAFVGLIATIVIVAFISAIVGKTIIDSQHKKDESVIETNKSDLETASRSYLLANGNYATDSAKLLKNYPKLTSQHNFQKVLIEDYSLTDGEISGRIQVVDVTSLKSGSFYNGSVKDFENYILDRVTGKVYYLKEDANLKELKGIAEQMLKDSNEVINLSVKEGDVFDLTVGGKTMSRVISTVQDGTKVILGGGVKDANDIKLLLVEVSPDSKGEASDYKLTDLTSKVAGGGLKTPITSLSLIQPGTVLAHYSHNDELKYELINY